MTLKLVCSRYRMYSEGFKAAVKNNPWVPNINGGQKLRLGALNVLDVLATPLWPNGRYLYGIRSKIVAEGLSDDQLIFIRNTLDEINRHIKLDGKYLPPPNKIEFIKIGSQSERYANATMESTYFASIPRSSHLAIQFSAKFFQEGILSPDFRKCIIAHEYGHLIERVNRLPIGSVATLLELIIAKMFSVHVPYVFPLQSLRDSGPRRFYHAELCDALDGKTIMPFDDRKGFWRNGFWTFEAEDFELGVRVAAHIDAQSRLNEELDIRELARAYILRLIDFHGK